MLGSIDLKIVKITGMQVHMKSIWGLFWVKEKDCRSLKVVPVSAEADVILMHQLVDPLHKDL
jgi:hypothetical protein